MLWLAPQRPVVARLVVGLLLGALPIGPARAQTPLPPAAGNPVPLEVMFGREQLVLQSVIIKDFAPESRFSFFTLTTFTAPYDNRLAQNNIVNLATVKYEFVPRFSVFGGVGFRTIQGFRPTGGFDYVLNTPTWLLVLKQSMDLTQTRNLQSLALLEFKPRFTQRLGLYSRVQGQYVGNPQAPEEVGSHVLSYLFLRLGLDYRQAQVGLAANLNWVGPARLRQENYGVFIRKEFD